MGENFITERISELCKKKNMSQYELSKRSGMTQSSLSTLMNQGSMPKITTVEKLCRGFGITLAQFFTHGDEFPDLSEEQLKILNVWETLSDKEKSAIEKIISSIIDMR